MMMLVQAHLLSPNLAIAMILLRKASAMCCRNKHKSHKEAATDDSNGAAHSTSVDDTLCAISVNAAIDQHSNTSAMEDGTPTAAEAAFDPDIELPPPLRHKTRWIWRHMHLIVLTLLMCGLAAGNLAMQLENQDNVTLDGTSVLVG